MSKAVDNIRAEFFEKWKDKDRDFLELLYMTTVDEISEAGAKIFATRERLAKQYGDLGADVVQNILALFAQITGEVGDDDEVNIHVLM